MTVCSDWDLWGPLLLCLLLGIMLSINVGLVQVFFYDLLSVNEPV